MRMLTLSYGISMSTPNYVRRWQFYRLEQLATCHENHCQSFGVPVQTLLGFITAQGVQNSPPPFHKLYIVMARYFSPKRPNIQVQDPEFVGAKIIVDG